MERPSASVLLITIDGLSSPVLDEMLAAGELPRIAGLIERGVRVRDARCSLPSLTYPNLTTILTGREPSRHGVLGNRWFDRYALVYRNYATIADYRLADDDLIGPTVYEFLASRRVYPGGPVDSSAFAAPGERGDGPRGSPDYGVSIQCAVRRGAGRVVDNWASSGIRWFFGAYEATDQLMPLRFDIIAEEAQARGRWPALIHAYFPGADEIGHRDGCDSQRYRGALANIDTQIGRMLEAIAQAGMADRTCTLLVSDHNHTPVPPKQWFDVAGWLRQCGLRVITEPPPNEPWEKRRRRYENLDAVVVIGGDRFAGIHLRGPNGWHERPSAEQVRAILGSGSHVLPFQKGVEAMATREEAPGGGFATFFTSNWGRSQLHARIRGHETEYREEIVAHIGLRRTDDLINAAGNGWHSGDELRRTGQPDSAYVADLPELLNSPRAGDIVLFAAEAWDFFPGGRGGHGGLGPIDTRVPMIFSGAMIDRAAELDTARLVDVTPTILGLLGRTPANADAMSDGHDWSGVLTRSAR